MGGERGGGRKRRGGNEKRNKRRVGEKEGRKERGREVRVGNLGEEEKLALTIKKRRDGKWRGKGVAKIGREEEKGGVFRGERVARREEEKGRRGREAEERKRRGGERKRRGEREMGREEQDKGRQGRGHGKERGR